jgi:hypothetical protein
MAQVRQSLAQRHPAGARCLREKLRQRLPISAALCCFRIRRCEWHGRARAWHGAFVPTRRAVLKCRANDPMSADRSSPGLHGPARIAASADGASSASINGTAVPMPGTVWAPGTATWNEKAVPTTGWARRSFFVRRAMPRSSSRGMHGDLRMPASELRRRLRSSCCDLPGDWRRGRRGG